MANNGKCLSIALPEIKKIRKELNSMLGLNNTNSVSKQHFKELIEVYCSYKKIKQEEVLNHLDEFRQFVIDSTGVNDAVVYKDDEISFIRSWMDLNSRKLFTPIDKKENARFLKDVKIKSLNQAKILPLENGEVFVVFPTALTEEAAKTKEIQEGQEEDSKSTTSPIFEYTLISGGATGADTKWGEIGAEYGLQTDSTHTIHYYQPGKKSPKGNVGITKEDIINGRKEVTRIAKIMYGYDDSKGEIQDGYVVRDYKQIENTDGVFAIANLMPKGSKFSDKKNETRKLFIDSPAGGTAYAVNLAIDKGIPVYVYNQTSNDKFKEGWYKYNYETQEYEVTDTPILTNRFTGIGSTKLTEKGENAIRDVYKRTLTSLGVNPMQARISDITKENLNPTNVSEENRQKDKELVISKFGKFQSFDTNVTSDLGKYRVVFEKGTIIIDPEAGYIRTETGESLGNKDINYFVGTLKIIEENLKNIESKKSIYTNKVTWAVKSDNSFEVSTKVDKVPGTIGDSRFSALKAKFKKGTIIEGVDVSGKTIEYVYQNVIKKSGKGKAPSETSKLAIHKKDESVEDFIARIEGLVGKGELSDKITKSEITGEVKLSKEDKEDLSYYGGYLPLWKEWAKQNPGLIEELRTKAAGKILTDSYADKTTVSQARALADILNESKELKNFPKSVIEVEYTNLDILPKIIFQDKSGKIGMLTYNPDNPKRHWIIWYKHSNGRFYPAPEGATESNVSDASYNKIISNVVPKKLLELGNNPEKLNKLYHTKLPKNKQHGHVYSELEEIIYNEYGIEFSFEEPTGEVSEKIKPAEKTLEDYVKEVEDAYQSFHKVVWQGENFSKDHKYYIKQNGKIQEVDISVTSLNAAISDIINNPELTESQKREALNELAFNDIQPKNISPSKGIYPQRFIGNSFDALVRKKFSKRGLGTASFKNLNAADVNNIDSQLDAFKGLLDEEFGAGRYKVITGIGDKNEEFVVGGFITDAQGNKVSVAGTLDMMVVTDTGDIYIYDMKTSSKSDGIESDLSKYRGQVTFYKRFLESVSPDFANRVKGVRFLVCNTTYNGRTNTEMREERMYSKFSEENGEVYYENKPVKSIKGFMSFNIDLNKNGTLVNMNEVKEINKLNMEPLTFEEEETLRDMPGGKKNVDFIQDGKKRISKIISEKTPEVDSPINEDTVEMGLLGRVVVETELSPVSPVEAVYIGRQMMKTISYILDRLNSDDNARLYFLRNQRTGQPIYTEPNYFVNMDRDKILTSTLFKELTEFIRTSYFRYSHLDINDPMYEKMKWINSNFTGIINSAANYLIDLEGVSLSGDTSELSLDNVPEDIKNMWEIGSRELDGREAYAIDSREKSYMSTIAQSVKRNLNKIPIVAGYNADGTPIKTPRGTIIFDRNKYGYNIPSFMDGTEVINIVYSIVHAAPRISIMINLLENRTSEYPWLNDIIKDLKEDKDNYRSKFFRSFRKNESYYSKIYVERTYDAEAKKELVTYRNIELNDTDKINTIIEYVNKRLNDSKDLPSLYEKAGSIPGIVTINTEALEEFKKQIKKIGTTQNRKSREIARALDYIGIDNIDNLNIFNTPKARNTVNDLKKILTGIASKLEKASKKFDKESKRSPVNVSTLLGDSYYNLARILYKGMEHQSEISHNDHGKSYMVFTDPSSIQNVLEALQDSTGVPYEQVMAKYDRYNQYGYDEEGERHYYSSWLRILKDDPMARELIHHDVRTTVDGKTHLKQSPKDYLMSLIMSYAAPMIEAHKYKLRDEEKQALFRVPIMSDKPAGENIKFYKIPADLSDVEGNFGLQEMKNEIAENAFEFFKFEINRMRSIKEHLLADPDTDIEFYHLPNEFRKKWVKNGKVIKITPEMFVEAQQTKRFHGFDFIYSYMFNNEIANKTDLGMTILDMINAETEEELQAIINPQISLWTVVNEDKLKDLSVFSTMLSLKDKFLPLFKQRMDEDFKKFKEDYADKYLDPEVIARSIPNIQSIRRTEGTLSPEGNNSYDAFLQEFFWNDYLATLNIYHLTIIDPAFYKDTVDLQKRYAEVHSSTARCNVEAQIQIGNKKYDVTDGYHRTIMLEDTTFQSDLKQAVFDVFENLEKNEKDPIKRAQFRMLKETIPSKFDSITETDGQAFSTPTGFLKKLIMLGEDNPEMREAILGMREKLNNIEHGDFDISNFSFVLQPFKPFVYTQIEHPDENTSMGKFLVPTQIKDSEALIYVASAILKGAGKDHRLLKLFKFLENSHYDKDGTWNGKGIDTITFHSAVKHGGFGFLHLPAGMTDDQIDAELSKCYDGNDWSTTYVKKFPFEDWGKQQEVPDHMQDHEQGEGSQFRIIPVADLPEDFECDVEINGKKKHLKKAALLKTYFNLISEDFSEGIKEVEEILNIKGTLQERRKALSKLLLNSVVKDNKYTDEVRKAFVYLANTGDFLGVIGDPSIADKVFSTIFSLIKKKVNIEEFQGGPVVQASPFGLSHDLHVKFDNPETREGLYYEAIVTCPTKELETRITYNSKKHAAKIKAIHGDSKTYYDGDLIDVDDAIALGLMTADEAEMMCNRIPTEDAYSICRCRVKRFLPRQMGELIILPAEITELSGCDFDVDKMFCKFRYNIKGLLKAKKNKKLSEIGEKLLKKEQRKNDIFNIQQAVMGRPEVYERLLRPGEFKELSRLADIVDKSRGEEHSLMNVMGQLYFQNANAGGKEFVGIGALNNISHDISNMAEAAFSEFPYFKINGVESFKREGNELKSGKYFYDEIYSRFDGSRISRTLGMFVGASADNAKEANLSSVNITPTTATLSMGLLRMGIPLTTVVYMMNHPLVRKASSEAEFTGKMNDFNNNIIKTFKSLWNNYIEHAENGRIEFYDLLSKTDFTDADLLARVEGKEVDEIFDVRVLGFLASMIPYCNDISDSSVVTSLNSTKNAVGPTVFDTIKRIYKIKHFFERIEDGKSTIHKSFLKIYDKIPFLRQLERCFTEVLPEIFNGISPIYSKTFAHMLDIIDHSGMSIEYMSEKEFKNILDSFLLYNASYKGIIDNSKEHRKELLYNFPIQFTADQVISLAGNGFIQNLGVSPAMNKKNQIVNVTYKSTSHSRDVRSEDAASWSALALNPKTKQNSDNILEYMFNRFGFSFSPKSAMNIAPNAAKLGFNGYREIFNLDNADMTGNFVNFIAQYMRNNFDSRLWKYIDLGDIKPEKTDLGETLYIPDALLIDDDIRGIGILGIKNKNKRYMLYKHEGDTAVYVRVSHLGIENNYMEYNALEDATSMETVVTTVNNTSQRKKYKGTLDSFEEDFSEDDNKISDEEPDTKEYNPLEDHTPKISLEEAESLMDNPLFIELMQAGKAEMLDAKELIEEYKEDGEHNIDVAVSYIDNVVKAAFSTEISEEERNTKFNRIVDLLKKYNFC